MFKEDEKAKIGRPRLAKDELISKARYSIFISLAICLVLGYCLFSYLNGKSPLDSIYSVSLKKVFGELSNKNGFIVNSYYDSNQDYIMNIKASDKVKSYQGNYVYQTYYLKNNKWILKDEKEIYTNKESFKIKFESKENKNVAWKIKLQIKNGSKIDESFAPYSWMYVDSDKQEEKCAYKVFTVKGYYSPVSEAEKKESLKNNMKVSVKTNKNDERTFLLSLSNNKYSSIVSYKDTNKKIVMLKDLKNVIGESSYKVPNLKVSTIVNFKVYIDGINDKNELKKYKLSSWEIKKDKNGNYYITRDYMLKPHQSY